ncbi:hypothetical protein BFP70_15505 [Thioclava sp. SK-1]|uniref:DUF2852 domain-containing protein n=1 Tax=Thioclava sp. SK-1 TaxID=1889770 RepID=UPI0008252E8C|nr:DUF2852 domain-containing protein [Thioclava sp. SK-1]OCX61428.1 hypothetical protein BFP70_15505 [Thioclava sp. SK-1]
MSYVSSDPELQQGPIRRAVDWMDQHGRMAWIVLMIGTFIFAGPLGLLVLGFMLVTGRFKRKFRDAHHVTRKCGPNWGQARSQFNMSRSSGNAAFDAYKLDTIARLEQEQDDFEAFLTRLRDARDKAEFDQYMEDRAKAAAQDVPASQDFDTQPREKPAAD